MAIIDAKLSSTSIDPSKYSIGQATSLTTQVISLLNLRVGRSLYYKHRIYKDAMLLNNPIKRRYSNENVIQNPTFGPLIGEKYYIWEQFGRQIAFLDDVGGLKGFYYGVNGSIPGYVDKVNDIAWNNLQKLSKNQGPEFFDNNGERMAEIRDFGSENGVGKYNIFFYDGELSQPYIGNYGVGMYLDKIAKLWNNNSPTVRKTIALNYYKNLGEKFIEYLESGKSVLDISKKSKFDKNGTLVTGTSYNERGENKYIDRYDVNEVRKERRENEGYSVNNANFGKNWGSTITEVGEGGEGISVYNEYENGIDHRGGYGDAVNNSVNYVGDESKGLLGFTNQLFAREKMVNTMINRFHVTDPDTGKEISRGRNLKAKKGEKVNNYDNPYCRVWTSHHQYASYSDRIRPFKNREGIESLQSTYGGMRPNNGAKRLGSFSTLDTNGFPIIAPHNDSENLETDVRRCMFSIENLAWKDVNFTAGVDGSATPILSKEQRGPYGGRIMWFPPYNLKFTENVNIQWEQNAFIGRGEHIYTYTNTERSGTLSFTILVDHPSVVDSWAKVQGHGIEEEQALLRFFAGCEPIDPPQEEGEPIIKSKDIVEMVEVEDAVGDISADPKPTAEGYEESFYVFFPNNLSGKDFPKDKGKMITYLSNYECGAELNGCMGDDGKPVAGKTMGKFHYQVDKVYQNQSLAEKNYKDSGNFSLNLSVNEKAKVILGISSDKTYKTFNDLTGFCNSNKSQRLPLSASDAYDLIIECKGYASSHGTDKANTELSTNRAKFLQSYIRQFDLTPSENVVTGNAFTLQVKNQDINSLDAKVSRAAVAIFKYVVKDSAKPTRAEGEINEEITNREKKQTHLEERIRTITTRENPTMENIFDNESQYFQRIAKSNSMIKKNLIEKVKFFDPAFHSITPEGFNSRLTFLHQCTRQGPTTSSADGENSTVPMGAGNLAFGRPPVCILRIGDFYNTKIIVDSISIDYDNGGGTSWDLNPEGIGVQPMLANIQMSFKFLGGSDLTGPIARLQNAISENFFANASVYNRRADYRDSWGTEANDKQKAWSPSMIDNINGNSMSNHKDFNPYK